MKVSGQLHAPATLLLGTHWIGSWVGLKVDIDDVKRKIFLPLPGFEPRPG
jgi:hypothetical protein